MSNKIKLRTFYGKEDIFSTNVGADNRPLKELVIGIEGYQEGSGDPSPTNVRPISGWTGANVVRSGKNLWLLGDKNVTRQSKSILTQPLPIGTYTISAIVTSTDTDSTISRMVFCNVRDIEITHTDLSRNSRSSATVTINEPCYYIYIFAGRTYSQSAGDTAAWANIQIETGSQATTYEPYTGTTYPITFPSEAGTVYSGTLDVTNGVLSVTLERIDLGSLSWIRQTSEENSIFVSYISNKKLGSVICSGYKYVGAKSNNDLFLMPNYSCGTHYSAAQVFAVKNDDYATANDFKTAMSGIQLVYPLATSIIYQLTPTQINTLLGTNNIWADCGHILKVTYPCDNDLCVKEDLNTLIDRIQ